MSAGSGRHAALLLAGLGLFWGCQAGEEPASGGAVAGVMGARASSGVLPDRFGIGRPATTAEIADLDIDIMPDGTGLPPGSGSVQQGSSLYTGSCIQCHGEELEGTPIGDRLVPPPDIVGFPDGEVSSTAHAIGNYWPFATTVFDYVRRAMPFDRPGSLTDEEVYAVTAFLLWRNGIVAKDAIMDATTLPAVEMPALGRFVVDDRLESNRVR